MKLVKCPRCELNYIQEGEGYCKICKREMKGESRNDEIELCTVCNEAPALPGKDVCLFCLKEMSQSEGEPEEAEMETADASNIGDMDDVSDMDEIIPEEDSEIKDAEYGEIDHQLSLEEVREDEERAADEEEEEEI